MIKTVDELEEQLAKGEASAVAELEVLASKADGESDDALYVLMNHYFKGAEKARVLALVESTGVRGARQLADLHRHCDIVFGEDEVMGAISAYAEEDPVISLHLGHYSLAQGRFEDAVRHLERAANGGVKEASARLGWMYRKGAGVEKDFIKAARWYSNIGGKKKDPTNTYYFVNHWGALSPVDEYGEWKDWEVVCSWLEELSPAMGGTLLDSIPGSHEHVGKRWVVLEDTVGKDHGDESQDRSDSPLFRLPRSDAAADMARWKLENVKFASGLRSSEDLVRLFLAYQSAKGGQSIERYGCVDLEKLALKVLGYNPGNESGVACLRSEMVRLARQAFDTLDLGGKVVVELGGWKMPPGSHEIHQSVLLGNGADDRVLEPYSLVAKFDANGELLGAEARPDW